ncbi:MAG: hypothetical protein PHI18_09505 [bacterium]|nr:hypothetical protein [bacterium]
MQNRSQLWLFAMLAALLFVAGSVGAADEAKQAESYFPPPLFDTEDPPPELKELNPYIVLVSMNSWTKQVFDHAGNPHEGGNVIQVIRDGGNGVQDPPRPDGLPGGDDSLAYGNFNMMRFSPPEDCPDASGRKGMFYSKKFFVTYQPPDRAYYLRIWEGDNVATAPYYQNSSEYVGDRDRGGAMIFLPTGTPMETDWTFGPSQPRPTVESDKK